MSSEFQSESQLLARKFLYPYPRVINIANSIPHSVGIPRCEIFIHKQQLEKDNKGTDRDQN